MTFKNGFLMSIVLAGGLAVMGNVLAAGAPKPHTWHSVRTLEGRWAARLQMINEGGSFVARDGQALTGFMISPDHSQEYGFIFDAGDDFDVAYTLTLTETKNTTMPQFVSKACVYVVTAKGPAQPDIRVSSFNGAKCDWNVVDGVGEDFTVA